MFIAAASGNLTYNVTETLPAHAFVGHVADDAGLRRKYSAAEFAQLRYSFLSSQPARWRHVFTVGHVDGVLRVGAAPLDRDIICAGQVVCAVPLRVQVEKPRFQIVLLTVVVIDVNDETPAFGVSSVTRAVSEAAPPGTRIALPPATDDDSPAYGVRSYSVAGSTLFAIDWADGEVWLTLTGRLDREAAADVTLRVVAADGGSPRRSALLLVHIRVTDANDNSPRFDNDTYTARVRENTVPTAPLVTLSATDADAADFGRVTYVLAARSAAEHGAQFRVDARSGALYLTGTGLDYEATHYVTLSVIAHDVNPDSRAVARVTVHVDDVNDNAPSITINEPSPDGAVLVPESAPIGSFVAHVTVVDADDGENGRFNCSLEHDRFRVVRLYETEFKVVTTATLDREAEARYDDVTLTCDDHGDPAMTSTQRIVVRVTDVNDHAPRFSQSVYRVEVEENNPPGTFLAQLTAADDDAGANAAVTYTLHGEHSALFRLDPLSGNLTAVVGLDREETPRVRLTVTAADDGVPPLTGTTTVMVDVTDVDDEPVRFSAAEYRWTVRENLAAGAVVGRVEAADRDGEGHAGFALSLQPADGPFTLDVASQTVYTRRPLDRETLATYRLVVKAVSDARPPVTADVTVTVTDDNDHTPVVTFPTPHDDSVTVWSGATLGHVVATVTAQDGDAADNARLAFHLVPASDVFHLDARTGVLRVARALDTLHARTLALTVRVSDGGTPPRAVNASLYVVVDRSARPLPTNAALAGANVTIVIVIAVVSSLAVVALLIAIVCLLRVRGAPSGGDKTKYNYVARAMDRKMSAAAVGEGDAGDGRATRRHDSFASGTGSDTSDTSSLQLTATGVTCQLSPTPLMALQVSAPMLMSSASNNFHTKIIL